MKGRNMNSIFLEPPTETEIMKIITNLKNASAGHDGIDMKIIKAIRAELISTLTHLCRSSIESGIVPDQLKTARVIAIFKKGDQSKVNNYRPVSVLPAFSKIYEKLMYNRMYDFFFFLFFYYRITSSQHTQRH